MVGPLPPSRRNRLKVLLAPGTRCLTMGKTARKSCSIQAEQSVDQLPFRGLDEVGVRNTHRMQGTLQFALPEFQELLQAGKQRRQVVVLPDKLLQQLGMVGHMVVDFRRRQAVALELHQEILADHASLTKR